MRKVIITSAILILAIVFLWFFLNSTEKDSSIRVGWQQPWVNQGQIAVILQKTGILQSNDVQAKFTGFSFGSPMTEAALSGQLDILFLGDQPAFNLISKDKSWKIVSPLVYYTSAILVPTNAEINSLSELKGKTIATGVGSTTYRDTIQLLKENGINSTEVTIKNLDVGQQLSFMQSARKSWGEIDAIASYDPTVTIAVSNGLAKPLKEYKSLGVIAVNKKFYDKNQEKVEKFLKSVKDAFEYYQKNTAQANQWYSDSTGYSISDQLYLEMSEPELKMQPKNEVQLTVTEGIRNELAKHLQTAKDLGLIKDLRLDEALLPTE